MSHHLHHHGFTALEEHNICLRHPRWRVYSSLHQIPQHHLSLQHPPLKNSVSGCPLSNTILSVLGALRQITSSLYWAPSAKERHPSCSHGITASLYQMPFIECQHLNIALPHCPACWKKRLLCVYCCCHFYCRLWLYFTCHDCDAYSHDTFFSVWDIPPSVPIKSIIRGFYLIILHDRDITNFEAVLAPQRSLHTKILGCAYSHEHDEGAHPL